MPVSAAAGTRCRFELMPSESGFVKKEIIEDYCQCNRCSDTAERTMTDDSTELKDKIITEA